MQLIIDPAVDGIIYHWVYYTINRRAVQAAGRGHG